MTEKSFDKAFQEWKKDNKYDIGDDIGDEFYDFMECPTHSERSSAIKEKWPRDSNTKDPQ